MGGYMAVLPAIPAQPTTKSDPFYGHETTSRLCARFITHLFAYPEYPPTSTHSQAKPPYFIAYYALHRTKLHASVTYALVLLQHLKARFPTARDSSGHCLFVIASKVICDDTYSNKSWSIVAQGMFTLRAINQMEREMCSYLDWELTVDNPILANFETMAKRDFRGPASTSNTPIPPPHTTTTSPIPVFGQQQQQRQQQQASPPKPAYINTNVTHSSPDTPSSSYSRSSTPASEALPTPPNRESHFVKVYDDLMPAFTICQVAERPPPIHPLKGKMLAFALSSV
ncbi:hypothetical protein CCMSSC00406_0001793 [Pleurotus cornucopiae]|uniref:Uncharacterized protein n=1 Tax=Pleurotus cornucopiae TaxID=5321 RepID=A0ACB7IMI3_PLECO|nr:hypothetical protein CCMSSC00406_0001793 [Pleurotus cornucopiae]